MTLALSVDLRERVVEAVADGASCRQAAARFGVSASSATLEPGDVVILDNLPAHKGAAVRGRHRLELPSWRYANRSPRFRQVLAMAYKSIIGEGQP